MLWSRVSALLLLLGRRSELALEMRHNPTHSDARGLTSSGLRHLVLEPQGSNRRRLLNSK